MPQLLLLCFGIPSQSAILEARLTPAWVFFKRGIITTQLIKGQSGKLITMIHHEKNKELSSKGHSSSAFARLPLKLGKSTLAIERVRDSQGIIKIDELQKISSWELCGWPLCCRGESGPSAQHLGALGLGALGPRLLALPDGEVLPLTRSLGPKTWRGAGCSWLKNTRHFSSGFIYELWHLKLCYFWASTQGFGRGKNESLEGAGNQDNK